MAQALRSVPTQDFLQKTLDVLLVTADTASATLNNLTGIQNLPGVFIVDRIDANGEETPSKREVILYTATSGVTVTTLTRGQAGTSAQDHAVGAIVEFCPDVLWAQSIYDALTQTVVASTGALDTTKVTDLTTAQTLTNKTLTSPKIGTAVLDTNGNESIRVTANASAVNDITVDNAATTFWPVVKATGDDTNIDIQIKGKGSGRARLGAAGLMFPDTDGTSGYVLKTDGSGDLSWVAQASGASRTRSVWLPANTFQSAEGTPTLSAGSNADTPSAWLLDDSAAVESVTGQVIIPEDYLSGNLTVKIYFAMVSATSGNVVVDTRLLSIASNADAIAAGTSQVDTIAVPGTAGLLKIATRAATFATGGAGEMLRISVRRTGSSGSDTAAGDMRFFGIKVEYTAVL